MQMCAGDQDGQRHYKYQFARGGEGEGLSGERVEGDKASVGACVVACGVCGGGVVGVEIRCCSWGMETGAGRSL